MTSFILTRDKNIVKNTHCCFFSDFEIIAKAYKFVCAFLPHVRNYPNSRGNWGNFAQLFLMMNIKKTGQFIQNQKHVPETSLYCLYFFLSNYIFSK
jgi:hypothetical protein